MWKTVRTAKYEARHKRFAKKKNKQLVQTLLNLELFEMHVQAGGRIKPFVFSFLHAEPMDVVAIDQSGGGKLPETRLYVWIDREAATVYLLTLGDKKTQHEDIQFCKACVEHIKADPGFGQAKEEDHGQEISSDDGG